MNCYRQHHYWTYITTNPGKTTLYTGMTNNLPQRLIEHWLDKGNKKHFAGRYHCYNLVYFEYYPYVLDAIAREKQIKGWSREQKMDLIKILNPNLKFLNTKFCKVWPPENGQKRG